jgi:trk system potassium uptake protein TrkA
VSGAARTRSRERRAAQRASRVNESEVLVIGLGRFGSALAEELVGLGYEVLAIDSNPGQVQRFTGSITQVVEADSTNLAAMQQLGVSNFSRAVVAIGTDIEASILTTALLVDLGVGDIWAKAITEAHGRILERVGAHHMVFPEHDMGQRVAHMVTGRMLDYMELDESFVLVETRAPLDLVGRSLGDVSVRAKYGVTVVCLKPAGEPFTYATADTVVKEGDILLVAGSKHEAEEFARRA